ncbi:ArsI/CadI family heavy metal resistance metalloenzyme [Niveispirillum sp.]|uniref:ArsI/CadI family heavy metal resistance metalloenzyme n=1 Tax=Niveispirillum sp. TaxID=1917217 RepID=UPI001B7A326B|nr:ArsI/CadI family heavy metal resistance metalloenzyme [Niveispirillum sp.]MBP7335911.1 VOC family protein [Niveispirillum sp.]
MKRLHLHVAVDDLAQSVRFYSTLFAAQPTVLKDDYAKWMLDDPRVNFAISMRDSTPGVEHLGIQVDSADELAEVYGRLRQADAPVLEEGHTTCCYAKSEKSWVTDPAGLSWEVFHTYDGSATYGGGATAIDPRLASTAAPTTVPVVKAKSACCGPAA